MAISMDITNEQLNTLIEIYQDKQIPPTNNYTLFCAKIKTSTLTIYKTLKLLLQGKDEYDVYIDICRKIKVTPTIPSPVKPPTVKAEEYYIGTDEVGTGDFFGGIVVCGAFVGSEHMELIRKYKVKDSKLINDYKILQLAPRLMARIPYAVLLLDCVKFNFLSTSQKLNMNQIKSLMHNAICNTMVTKVTKFDGIIVDGFTDTKKYYNYLKNEKKVCCDVVLVEKAEDKYVSVACASIIARYYFLKHLDDLSKKINFDLPKGAGKKVDTAIKILYNAKGLNYFRDIAKMKFKNLNKYKN